MNSMINYTCTITSMTVDLLEKVQVQWHIQFLKWCSVNEYGRQSTRGGEPENIFWNSWLACFKLEQVFNHKSTNPFAEK